MPVKKPKLLVLDGQGVVFDAPIKRFLLSFSQHNELDYEIVEQRWENRLRMLAWTGAIDDDALWNELANKTVDLQQTIESLKASYQPGPVADYLHSWSQQLPIWLLSNHRSHWVLPQLESLNLSHTFQRLLVSDNTGCVKPDPAAFAPLLDGNLSPGDILFVDDQLHNLQSAEKLGLETLHATFDQAWVTELDLRIRK